MQQIIKRILGSPLPLYSLLSLGFGLRLVKLEQLFHFTYDEEVFAFVGKRMFVNHHIPLIGGVTPMHVHVAPYFYWMSGFVLFIAKLNPVGWGIAAAIIAGITMRVLFAYGKKTFGEKAAYMAVVLYGFSFFQNVFDRHYWGLTFDGLVSVVTLYCLYQIKAGRKAYAYLLAVILAFGFHTDLSTFNLILLTVLVFVFMKIQLPLRQKLIAIAIFAISFLPLIIFDLKHNFSNSRGFLQYFNEIKAGKKEKLDHFSSDPLLFVPRALSRSIYVFGDTDLARQYSYCRGYVQGRLMDVPTLMVLFVFVTLGLFYYMHRKNPERFSMMLILCLFGSTFTGLVIYGYIFKGDLFDHYAGTLYPVFYLVISSILVKVCKRTPVLILTVVALFIFLNLRLFSQIHHRFGFTDKKMAVQWAIAQTGSEPFSLDVISSCFRYNGYRYLFFLYGKEPVKSYVDTNFSYLYDVQPSQIHPKQLVVITNPDFAKTKEYLEEHDRYRQKTVKSQKFGEIEVLLVDNSNLDFVGKF